MQIIKEHIAYALFVKVYAYMLKYRKEFFKVELYQPVPGV